MSSAGGCVIYLIFGFFAGLWYIYSGVKKYRLAQKINNTATSKVDAAAVGLVELYGTARCVGDMRSPVSKEKCAFWRIIGQYYRSGKGGGWRQIYRKDSSEQFYLEDETGKMLIEPEGGEVVIPNDHTYQGYISGKGIFGVPHTQMPNEALRFIDSLDDAGKRAFMNHQCHDVRIYEHFIANGDKVYVLGDAVPRGGNASEIGHENLIVRKKGEVLYISDTAEKAVSNSLGYSSRWEIAWGFIASAACLFILVLIFSNYLP